MSGPIILLVEDSPDDVVLIHRSFKKAQIAAQIHVVNDGEAAIRYLAGEGEFADREAHPLPNLVLLDLKLPLKSGFEVLAWIRANPDLRRTLVVVLTSSAELQDVRHAYDLGANSYLVKPVSPDAMQSMAAGLGLYWFSLNQAPPVHTGV